ncbi:MAG: hypothetical protein HC817_13620, partial [Saprospiraceae bacterium]|nr:hypothetical protein [Saprospiraceae bacterium]
KYNTRGSIGGLADQDSLFESDETVTIIENFCIVNCDLSRNSTHAMSWGCDARFCNTITESDFVSKGEGSASVGFVNDGTLPNIVGGYCLDGRQTIKFTNTGVEVDGGTGTMYDIKTGIGFNGTFDLQDKNVTITKLVVAGVEIPSPTTGSILVSNNPLFTDGNLVQGLEDIDGDGFFDDLSVGKFYEVTVEYTISCGVSIKKTDSTGLGEARFNAHLDYSDACQGRNFYPVPEFFAPQSQVELVENCVDPDALTNGTPFLLSVLIM